MNRKLCLYLICSFLAVQVLSTLHMVDYGVHEHDHHGELCEFYLHAEKTKSSDLVADISIELPSYRHDAYAIVQIVSILPQRYSPSAPRAPPVFS